MTDINQENKISLLNDDFRKYPRPEQGKVLFTHGIQCLKSEQRSQIFQLVQSFNKFTEKTRTLKRKFDR